MTTLAGSGTIGYQDGAPDTAQFSTPQFLTVDAAGNVYVADKLNNCIRKITVVAGVATDVSTLPGKGSFTNPRGVAVDSATNVYVAATGSQTLVKITPAGVVSTLAGSGVAGFADGTGAAAQFNSPRGLAVDAAGNIYVADVSNNRIRKVTPDGVVTTLAGSGTYGFADGPGAAAQFEGPYGVVVDGSGDVYVGDTYNHRIRKITPASLPLLLAQSGLTGTNPVPVSLAVTGLLPETTYYYRSVTTNLAGTAYGDFLTFTTPSTNAALASLALSAGTLTPDFAAATVSYTATVLNATASLTVTPTAAQANAAITVNGNTVASGSASGAINLVVGPNTITVAVTAQDGVTLRNYSVVVTRVAAPPVVTTLAATGIASNAAVLQSLINPKGSSSSLFFQYGTSTNTDAGMAVTTLAGTNTAGYAEGTGAAAQFNIPIGVAMDASEGPHRVF